MSDLLVKHLQKLREEQASHALTSVLKPGGRDAFEFGRVSGISQGLQRAIQLAEELLNDKGDDDDKRQTSPRRR